MLQNPPIKGSQGTIPFEPDGEGGCIRLLELHLGFPNSGAGCIDLHKQQREPEKAAST